MVIKEIWTCYETGCVGMQINKVIEITEEI